MLDESTVDGLVYTNPDRRPGKRKRGKEDEFFSGRDRDRKFLSRGRVKDETVARERYRC